MTHAAGLDARGVWDATLDALRADTSMTTPAYKTWFEQTTPIEVCDKTMVVVVPNGFARDWLESRFAGLLAGALERVVGRPMRVDFVVDASPSAAPPEEAPIHEEPVLPDLEAAEQRRVQEAIKGDFNPKYTFDSFVMGASNRFAYHSALAVAEAPGRAYNPLFIYGGVGLGKTHLLQAIGHYVQNTYTHLRVKYVSSEQFTNDFINSIGDKARIEGFRRQYRTNDVLLVDDIQFIAGKTGTEEEFFHTFNTLQQAGKQIVLSSDSPPKDITQLAERLRSRFEMGLITDIQPPELETRVAILRRKVELEGLLVPDEVLTFIASRIASNIRELEGALIRVVAFGSLTRHDIDTEIAQSVLKDIFPERSVRPISVSSIQQEACRFYGLSRGDLVGNKRSQAIVYPRQVAMYLSRELTDLSLPRIGAEFGGRDHTTVMHATAKIRTMLTEQREVYNQIQSLTNLIKQKN